MRRPPQLGHTARALHENGTSRSAWQASQRTREAFRPDAAREELPEFTLDERWNTTAFFGGPQEGREVHPHHPMQYRVLGGARAIGTDARG